MEVSTNRSAKEVINEEIRLMQQDDDISFFVAIRRIIKASGMNYSTIAEQATMNSATDPFYHPLICRPMNVSTVSNIARAIDLPTYPTLRRLAIYALGLSDPQCLWLESKRRQEDYVHHTTNPQLTTVKNGRVKPKKISQTSTSGVPEWIEKK